MIKRTLTLSKALLGTALLAMVFTVSSCKKSAPDDSKEAAEQQNDQKFDEVNEPKQDDADYLVAAAETDLMEIELGKLALSKTSTASVKDLAKMMIDEHTKASAATKTLAETKQISLPLAITDKGKEHYDDLNGKSGKDFDKDYADMMVDGHQDAISKIEDASKNANDPQIRQWAADMLPTLRTHLEHAKMVRDGLK